MFIFRLRHGMVKSLQAHPFACGKGTPSISEGPLILLSSFHLLADGQLQAPAYDFRAIPCISFSIPLA